MRTPTFWRTGFWWDVANHLVWSPPHAKGGAYTEQLPRVTRVTLVDGNGLVKELWNQRVTVSYQDDGRTLKVFCQAKDPSPDGR